MQLGYLRRCELGKEGSACPLRCGEAPIPVRSLLAVAVLICLIVIVPVSAHVSQEAESPAGSVDPGPWTGRGVPEHRTGPSRSVRAGFA